MGHVRLAAERPTPGRTGRHPVAARRATSGGSGEGVLALQRLAGNQAVVQLFADFGGGGGGGGGGGQALEDKDLVSPHYAGNARLQQANDNAPPMRYGESGEAVTLVQQGLVADNHPMPGSTKPDGRLDGIFGSETRDALRCFQDEHELSVDGVAGRETMGTLDRLAAPPVPKPKPGTSPICPGGAPQTYDQRIAALTREHTRVYGMILGGLQNKATDHRSRLWRNSCQWITANRVPFQLLIKTHDFETRAAQVGGMVPGLHAYFDAAVFHPTVGGTYAPVPTVNDSHVHYLPPDVGGTAPKGKIQLIDSECDNFDGIQGRIIHEVQHNAGRADGLGKPAEKLGPKWEEYVDEFRAHWLQTLGTNPDSLGSPTAPATNTRKVLTQFRGPGRLFAVLQSTNFKNQRQERVFFHMVDRGYGFARPYVTQDKFRKAVDDFARPAGVNLANSLRIDDLLTAVAACEPTMKAFNAALVDVRAKTRKLDGYDRSILRDEPTSATFWQQATAHLPASELKRLRASVAVN